MERGKGVSGIHAQPSIMVAIADFKRYWGLGCDDFCRYRACACLLFIFFNFFLLSLPLENPVITFTQLTPIP